MAEIFLIEVDGKSVDVPKGQDIAHLSICLCYFGNEKTGQLFVGGARIQDGLSIPTEWLEKRVLTGSSVIAKYTSTHPAPPFPDPVRQAERNRQIEDQYKKAHKRAREEFDMLFPAENRVRRMQEMREKAAKYQRTFAISAPGFPERGVSAILDELAQLQAWFMWDRGCCTFRVSSASSGLGATLDENLLRMELDVGQEVQIALVA